MLYIGSQHIQKGLKVTAFYFIIYYEISVGFSIDNSNDKITIKRNLHQLRNSVVFNRLLGLMPLSKWGVLFCQHSVCKLYRITDFRNCFISKVLVILHCEFFKNSICLMHKLGSNDGKISLITDENCSRR